jgi:hypothetical protein
MIRKGQVVRIKPQWQDKGDDKYVWVALDYECGGRVAIQPQGTGLAFPPHYIVSTDWLEQSK